MRYPVGRDDSDFKNNWYIALGYGEAQPYGFHEGGDINKKTGGDTDLGENLYAIKDGEITHVDCINKETGFGNELHLKISGTFGTRFVHYAHCKDIFVKLGDHIKEGQIIATLGKSGRPRNLLPAHLHFAIKKKPSGIGNVANTRAELEEYWEDPIEFIEKYKNEGESMDNCLLPNNPENKALYEKLVDNSLKADSVVRYLNLGEKAEGVSYETIEKSLAARIGGADSLKSKLQALEQEVGNRVEQVSRLESQLLEHKELHNAEIIALKSNQTSPEAMIEPFKSRIEALEKQIDTISKQKGAALLELSETKAKLEAYQKGTFSVTIIEKVIAWVKSVWKR